MSFVGYKGRIASLCIEMAFSQLVWESENILSNVTILCDIFRSLKHKVFFGVEIKIADSKEIKWLMDCLQLTSC